MFRLVVVAAVVAVASAGLSHHAHWDAPVVATSYASHPVTHIEKQVIPGRTWTEVQPQVRVVEQPYITKVGDQVHNVPTGVSYQSSSVVHSKNVVTPILAQGVQKHLVQAEPLVKHYQEPALVKTVATQQHVAYAAAPVVHKTIAAPVAYAAPLSYAAHAAPLAYAAHAAPVAYAAHAAPVAYSAPLTYAAHAPVVQKTLAYSAPLSYASHGSASLGYAAHAPVVSKSVWGNHGVVAAASPYSYGYGLGAKTVVASPWAASGWEGQHAW